jgi:hypothetical protein
MPTDINLHILILTLHPIAAKTSTHDEGEGEAY